VLWDPATGISVAELDCREIGYFDRHVAAFSPDGSRLALCTRLDPVIRDTSNGRPVLTLLGHTAPVRSVEFSPDGQWMVTASEDGTLRKWRTVDGANIGIWKHDTEVSIARVSPDGRWVVASDRNRGLTVRDSRTGQVVARIELLPAPEWPLLFEFSPNSECLAVARYDGAPVELRETRSGILLGHFREDSDNAERRSLQFSPDGRGVGVGNYGSPARVYPCEVCGEAEDLLAVVGRRVQRVLSADERARFIPTRQ
jgi:WD40 repeat protein